MLDIPRMDRIRLSSKPRAQRLVAGAVLAPNYGLGGVRIALEHVDRLPEEPVVFAMNHTDRYNYWPFQYALWRRHQRYTATWVKGKYYESPWVGRFMEMTNNIPTVSRGYVIAKDFAETLGRQPTDAEYAALRARVDGGDSDAEIPRALLSVPRSILGRRFDPTRETYFAAIRATFRELMDRFVSLNEEVFSRGLDLLVFPEGTRSLRVSKGHIGLAEIALKFQRIVVPVGCSGSDRVYPGSSPIARRGNIVYRFGEPIRPSARLPEDFVPFDPDHEARHRETLQGYVDEVMARIDALVDPEYRSEDGYEPAVRGVNRFL